MKHARAIKEQVYKLHLELPKNGLVIMDRGNVSARDPESGDEFSGPIPCAGFALIGGEGIGKQVVEHIGLSLAVLLKNHGVFTIGPTAQAAVKAAVIDYN